MKADPDVIAVIDSILAEAGDERAPAIHCICWRYDRDDKSEGNMLTIDIQGWVDRLRGIRAALEAKE
jgi:hypothetical protein